MPLLRRFSFILFLAIAGFMVTSDKAHAGDITPSINITYARVSGFPEAEARGFLYDTTAQPELSFTLIDLYGEEISVPFLSTVWSPGPNNSQQWTAILDLSDVPAGIYNVLVSAKIGNYTIFDLHEGGNPGECLGGVCLPNGGGGW